MEPASRKRVLSVTIGAVLAAALLYYSLRGVDWRELARILATADTRPLILGAFLATVSLFVRARRWRVLLEADSRVSAATAFWATAAGYFGNNFLPARAGELIRTFMVSSRTSLETSFVLATALTERVADAIALVTISAAVLLVLPVQPGWFARAARPFALIGLLGVLAIVVLPMLGSTAQSVVALAPLPRRLKPRLAREVDHALRGIRAFHHARRLVAFLALTILLWFIDALGTVIVASALGMDMAVTVAFLLMAGLGVASALPSTPGYVGIYQFVAVTVLTPFGFTRTDAIAFIIVVQALNYAVIGGWGAAGFWRYRRERHST